VGDKGGEATTLTNLGDVYAALGEKAKALEYYAASAAAEKAGGGQGRRGHDPQQPRQCLRCPWGDKRKALEYYEQALPLYRQVGDKGGEATTLNNLGLVYSDLGEKRKALEYYAQALPLFRQVGTRAARPRPSTTWVSVYDDFGGEAPGARVLRTSAAASFRQVGDKGGEAWTLNKLGGCLLCPWGEGKALEYYEQALRLSKAGGGQGRRGHDPQQPGQGLLCLGETDKALEYSHKRCR
jgi:tetratricopeptide (TPR) repeat protein